MTQTPTGGGDVEKEEKVNEPTILRIELSPRVAVELQRLADDAGITRSEVLRRAVALYRFAEANGDESDGPGGGRQGGRAVPAVRRQRVRRAWGGLLSAFSPGSWGERRCGQGSGVGWRPG